MVLNKCWSLLLWWWWPWHWWWVCVSMTTIMGILRPKEFSYTGVIGKAETLYGHAQAHTSTFSVPWDVLSVFTVLKTHSIWWGRICHGWDNLRTIEPRVKYKWNKIRFCSIWNRQEAWLVQSFLNITTLGSGYATSGTHGQAVSLASEAQRDVLGRCC